MSAPRTLKIKRLAGVKTLRPFRLPTPKKESRQYQTGDRPWRKLREVILARDPICVKCGIRASTDVDHVDVDGWNNDLEENLQGLCHECHSRKTLTEDISALPLNLKPSGVPLYVVCGPPGSGKTTFCRNQAHFHDLIIDFDVILASLSRKPMYSTHETEWILAALRERNRQLRLLKDLEDGQAFFIVSAPTMHERRFWREALKPKEIVVMATDYATCTLRLQQDNRRAGQWEKYAAVARKWWLRYAELPDDRVITEG